MIKLGGRKRGKGFEREFHPGRHLGGRQALGHGHRSHEETVIGKQDDPRSPGTELEGFKERSGHAVSGGVGAATGRGSSFSRISSTVKGYFKDLALGSVPVVALVPVCDDGVEEEVPVEVEVAEPAADEAEGLVVALDRTVCAPPRARPRC